jgi:DNA (cytosine-5)-methyltransferase 1
VDDGISAWLARTRLALGSRKGTSAASLIVEAFGDAVVPQIPEAIGRAILRSEAALNAVLGDASAGDAAAGDDASVAPGAGDAAADGDAADQADGDADDSTPTNDPADRGGAS